MFDWICGVSGSVIFIVIAIVALVILAPAVRFGRDDAAEIKLVKCPSCERKIPATATRCPHCQEILGSAPDP